MDPRLIANLKQQYVHRRPTVRFETDNDGYLGDGSFSITFAAWDGPVPCVVKFSKRPWAADPGVAKERQALLELMLQCNGHPHVANLHYFDDDVLGHLATQWERGENSLEQRLKACLANGERGISREELRLYMEQAARGLDFVNGRGIVHRDVKPENLLLFQGQVKLIDFGFARLSEISSATNSVLGTPIFAPAEANDGRLNPNVDIYCLAGTFIRLLTGQYPFGGSDDLRQRKREGRFQTEGLLPHEIEALRGALAADPRDRPFESASDFVAALTVPPPPVFVPGGTSPPTIAATQPARPAGGRSFVDKIRQIVSHEESERAQATAAAAERLAQLRQQFTELLHKQLDTGDFALAYGTVNYLLRGQVQQVQANELSEVKQFLESRDTHGRVRGEDECGIRFALIPPGAFAMGSPFDEEGHEQNEFPHRVLLTKPYYMAIHPTTVGQFSEFVHATAYKTDDKESWRDPGFTQDKTHPVVNVSHVDAMAFCDWMSKRTGKRYGLPTEAQWEYAARAGTTTRYWWGDTIRPNHANYHDSDIKGTTPVGKYAANPWGLLDVSGNVLQWCADWYDGNYYRESPEKDPLGPPSGSSRVLRGGSWLGSAFLCRCAKRGRYVPHRHDGNFGFRAALLA